MFTKAEWDKSFIFNSIRLRREWLHGLQRRPLSEKVAEDEGVFVVEPLQGMRKVVFEGTGEPICEAHFVTNEAAARGHELFEGAHGGTLGLQGLERNGWVAM